MEFDFTLKRYSELIDALKAAGYRFSSFEDFMLHPGGRTIVLRHDVDRFPARALEMAELENARSVKGSYHFRVYGDSFDPGIIKTIASLGHEIAYHYEDLSRVAGNKSNPEDWVKEALHNFDSNLKSLRSYYPVKVISMHGDPSQSYDNRDLWDHFNYKSLGLLCEPYLDIDYTSVLYLTDTGRRWDADSTNIRDKIPVRGGRLLSEEYNFKTTAEIILKVKSGTFPAMAILSSHPQRWSDNRWIWLQELVWQNTKNAVKYLLSKFR